MAAQPSLLISHGSPMLAITPSPARDFLESFGKSLKKPRAIVILATHDLELAEGLLDEAVFLREGRIASTMSRPEGLRSAYRDVMGRG